VKSSWPQQLNVWLVDLHLVTMVCGWSPTLYLAGNFSPPHQCNLFPPSLKPYRA
jgi:hypothetical protein